MPANYTKTSSPLLSNTQPCLAPVSLALQQVTNYLPASAAGLQVDPQNPEDPHGTAIPGLLREPHPSPHPQAELGARHPPPSGPKKGVQRSQLSISQAIQIARERMAHGNSNPNILKRPGQAKPKSTSLLNLGPWGPGIKISRSLFLQVIVPGVWEGNKAALCLQQGKILLLNSCVPFSKFLNLSETLLPP